MLVDADNNCSTTRLSASRVLRARKICAFIFDKLELSPARGRTAQGTNGSQAVQNGADELPEDVIELLCGHTVVDPKITLATLKQYYGTGGDMLLHYRLRQGVTVA